MVVAVPDQQVIFRLVWHPVHFDALGRLKPGAFSSSDLLGKPDEEGKPKYVSVDRGDIIDKAATDWTIDRQQSGGKAELHQRHAPKFAEFICGEVRGLTADPADDEKLFNVTPEPITADPAIGRPANDAHCGIRTIAKPDPVMGKNVFLDMLRTKLIKAQRMIREYQDVFPDENAA